MTEKEDGKKFFVDYITVLVKWRFFIIKLVAVTTALGIVISFLLTQKFTATATILPPNPEQEAMIGMISANIPAGLTRLGRLTGMMPGASTASELFAAIMQSEHIKNEVIKRYNLTKEFKAKTKTDARKILDEMTKIELSNEGIVRVSVTYKNKFLAADIANAYIEELDKFNTKTAITTGKKYRIFIEQRLKETKDNLANNEEALRSFQEKHKTGALDEEIKSVIATIAKLKSEIILRQVQKAAWASSSPINNPYLANINRELRELERQLSKIEFGGGEENKKEFGAGFSVPLAKLPEVSLEYARLLRDVKIQEAIYGLLVEQYEQAKIMEVKDTPTVQFLDRATPPEKRSFPRRSRIVAFAAITSLIVGIFLSYFFEYLQHLKKTQQWRENYNILKQDFTKVKKKISNIFIRYLRRIPPDPQN